jgi:hypothetical protein
VALGVGHASRFEPAVEHLRHPTQYSLPPR